MPAETIAAFRPLADFVYLIDVSLHDFVPATTSNPLDRVLVSEAWTDFDGDSFTLGASFHLDGIADLQLPGLDQFSLSLNEDAQATASAVTVR